MAIGAAACACNSQPVELVSGPSPSPTFVSATATPTIAAPATEPETRAAVEVAQQFLSSLASDPSGKAGTRYLSVALRKQVEQGTPASALLGIQNTYRSFNLSTASADPTHVVLRATLYFSTPVQPLLTQIKENGEWRVDQIAGT